MYDQQGRKNREGREASQEDAAAADETQLSAALEAVQEQRPEGEAGREGGDSDPRTGGEEGLSRRLPNTLAHSTLLFITSDEVAAIIDPQPHEHRHEDNGQDIQ